MPKKKTGQRKKAERAKERQKVLASQRGLVNLLQHPANSLMECTYCGKRQRNRAFCYFCAALPRLPNCCNCGRQKCTALSGDCLVKHSNTSATGLLMVGAICDFCEAWVCHSSRCIGSHACSCPLIDSACTECDRTPYDHGGRIFSCAYCQRFLCEDDQFEHQASCQQIESENFKCQSCNRIGSQICMRCKITFCDEHSKRKGFKYDRGSKLPCPKCGHEMTESYQLGASTRGYKYGRQTEIDFHGGDSHRFGDDSSSEEEGSSGEDYGTEEVVEDIAQLQID